MDKLSHRDAILSELDRRKNGRLVQISDSRDGHWRDYFGGAGMELIVAFVTALVMLAGFWLFRWGERMHDRITALEKENEALKAANKKHLPYQTLEDLEHAKAAWIALMSELEIKTSIVQNLGAWIDKARSDPRGKQ